jgi:hypothetical protein
MFRKRLKYLGYGHPAIAGFGDRGCDFLIKSLLYLGSILRLNHYSVPSLADFLSTSRVASGPAGTNRFRTAEGYTLALGCRRRYDLHGAFPQVQKSAVTSQTQSAD